MPLLSSLVLPDAAAADAAVASLQKIAPPVLSVEALLERDLEALEAQIDLPRGGWRARGGPRPCCRAVTSAQAVVQR